KRVQVLIGRVLLDHGQLPRDQLVPDGVLVIRVLDVALRIRRLCDVFRPFSHRFFTSSEPRIVPVRPAAPVAVKPPVPAGAPRRRIKFGEKAGSRKEKSVNIKKKRETAVPRFSWMARRQRWSAIQRSMRASRTSSGREPAART